MKRTDRTTAVELPRPEATDLLASIPQRIREAIELVLEEELDGAREPVGTSGPMAVGGYRNGHLEREIVTETFCDSQRTNCRSSAPRRHWRCFARGLLVELPVSHPGISCTALLPSRPAAMSAKRPSRSGGK